MSKILLIEDDMFLQGLEAAKLQKAGYEVAVAVKKEDIMREIFQPDVDLVLLDLMLPDVDGFEVLKAIRADERTKTLPVKVFSNLSEEKDLRTAERLGANGFMVKANFTLEELCDRIEKILSEHRNQRPA